MEAVRWWYSIVRKLPGNRRVDRPAAGEYRCVFACVVRVCSFFDCLAVLCVPLSAFSLLCACVCVYRFYVNVSVFACFLFVQLCCIFAAGPDPTNQPYGVTVLTAIVFAGVFFSLCIYFLLSKVGKKLDLWKNKIVTAAHNVHMPHMPHVHLPHVHLPHFGHGHAHGQGQGQSAEGKGDAGGSAGQEGAPDRTTSAIETMVVTDITPSGKDKKQMAAAADLQMTSQSWMSASSDQADRKQPGLEMSAVRAQIPGVAEPMSPPARLAPELQTPIVLPSPSTAQQGLPTEALLSVPVGEREPSSGRRYSGNSGNFQTSPGAAARGLTTPIADDALIRPVTPPPPRRTSRTPPGAGSTGMS